ncbi:hypothetical protein EY643_16710 [Halioglobus maricola]|uniref:O-antigen ligase domain-containing protein n=1 Tax=Halioglobus maricola TaxID=2601894 RepID=A0A5P9NNZ4_9GAMM|nr:hypothetical protein [Halioglobus maricola]QFU77165.1 hypothetical protein EY643_16710 [Halioglobus maricola]
MIAAAKLLPELTGTKSPGKTSVDIQGLLLWLLWLGLFAGFQGGRYYMANRLQEVGIACALLLFIVGAWRSLFRLPLAEWRRWVLGPVLLLGGIMLVSAVVFALQYRGNVLYSLFSAREFLLGFLGPAVYLLVRCGLPLAGVRRAVWLALFALMVNYLFFYATMDLSAAFFSSDHTVSNLVTFDEWRGFRLKPPLFAIMLALLGGLYVLTQSRRGLSRIGALLLVLLAAYIWSIVQFRSTLATLLVSVLLYPLLLAHPGQLRRLVLLAPLVLLAAPYILLLAAEHFLNADGGSIRLMAFAAALEHIPSHLLLGAGEDSAYGDSYQDIVAPYFYPSDLGLVGVTYKYGLVGLGVYLVMHVKIWLALYRANMGARVSRSGGDPLLWGCLIFMTAQSFNLLLNPGLAYAQGITLGSFAIALAALSIRSRNASHNELHIANSSLKVEMLMK